MRQLLEHAAEAFGGGTQAGGPVYLAPFHAKIGQLALENEDEGTSHFPVKASIAEIGLWKSI